MPKRRLSELDGGGRTADRPRSHRRQQHLYLVFDDWSFGYSIREVNLLADAGEGADQRLPRAFLRWAAPRRLPQYFTSAFGSRIMLMHSKGSSAVPIIDVRKRSIILGPEPDYLVDPIYFPIAGDRLFALDANSFEFCRWRLEQPDEDGLLPEQPHGDSSQLEDPVGDKGSWCQLKAPPFDIMDVTSYVVHSDGETILVSTKSDASVATFTFNTDKLVWKQLGEWKLPFTGRGHFVRYLEAFVGLSKDSETLGYLYACKVPSTDTGKRQCPAPAWRLSKEKIFSKNTAERHVGATLVYTGHRGKFCLVECVSVKEDRADQLKKREDVSQCSRYMYRLMTFSLRYDMMGDLRVKHCRVRCYKVPNKASTEFLHEADPVAFWL